MSAAPVATPVPFKKARLLSCVVFSAMALIQILSFGDLNGFEYAVWFLRGQCLICAGRPGVGPGRQAAGVRRRTAVEAGVGPPFSTGARLVSANHRSCEARHDRARTGFADLSKVIGPIAECVDQSLMSIVRTWIERCICTLHYIIVDGPHPNRQKKGRGSAQRRGNGNSCAASDQMAAINCFRLA